MGAAVGYLIGGALLGLGLSSMNKTKTPSSSSANVNYDTIVSTTPASPEAPVVTTDDGAQKSEAMLAAEEEERQRLAAQQEANRTNYTSGLGVASQANVGLKTLLG